MAVIDCSQRPVQDDVGSGCVLGLRINTTSYPHAVRSIMRWAEAGESRYVCVSTVHMTMESYSSEVFRQVVNGADLVTPDGMPLVWSLRLLGNREQQRVYGPDLTLEVLKAAAAAGVGVGFFGGRPEVLEHLVAVARDRFPGLKIVYAESPPFRETTQEERRATVEAINASGARILFVGLGCPKQERWMAEHRGQVSAVMLGVGAAFNFLTGTTKQAPRWVMGIGMEWMFRLLMEPRRLWKRYLTNNPRFVALFFLQLTGLKRFE